MDIGYTYASQDGDRLALYVRPGLEPASVVELTENGQPVRFDRVSDRELACGKVAGVDGSCESFDYHRAELGNCKCGRHKQGVRIRKAVRS